MLPRKKARPPHPPPPTPIVGSKGHCCCSTASRNLTTSAIASPSVVTRIRGGLASSVDVDVEAVKLFRWVVLAVLLSWEKEELWGRSRMPPTIWWKAASTLFMVSLRSREGRLFGLFVFANLDHARFGSDFGTKVERAFVLVGWRNVCVAPLPAINLNRK